MKESFERSYKILLLKEIIHLLNLLLTFVYKNQNYIDHDYIYILYPPAKTLNPAYFLPPAWQIKKILPPPHPPAKVTLKGGTNYATQPKTLIPFIFDEHF